MSSYLFDAMVHVQARTTIPEKWKRQWKEATTGAKQLILTEPLIAETFYQLIRKEGEKAAQKRIFWLKGLRSCRIVPLDDHHALEAGRLFLRFRHLGISLADAFSLSVARMERAEIFTSDHGIRDACRSLDIEVSYLPLKDILA